MLRTPLWPPKIAECFAVGSLKAAPVPVLDPHELAAGKLAALLARSANRDIFDAHRLLAEGGFDRAKLRLGFVVYGGINRKEWRTVSPEDVKGDVADAARDLVPMLRVDLAPARSEVAAWLDKLVAECRERLAVVLPFERNEMEFLDRLNGAGEIVPELLTDDPADARADPRDAEVAGVRCVGLQHRRPAGEPRRRRARSARPRVVDPRRVAAASRPDRVSATRPAGGGGSARGPKRA